MEANRGRFTFFLANDALVFVRPVSTILISLVVRALITVIALVFTLFSVGKHATIVLFMFPMFVFLLFPPYYFVSVFLVPLSLLILQRLPLLILSVLAWFLFLTPRIILLIRICLILLIISNDILRGLSLDTHRPQTPLNFVVPSFGALRPIEYGLAVAKLDNFSLNVGWHPQEVLLIILEVVDEYVFKPVLRYGDMLARFLVPVRLQLISHTYYYYFKILLLSLIII